MSEEILNKTWTLDELKWLYLLSKDVKCNHDHLNEDGICRRCGEDCRQG